MLLQVTFFSIKQPDYLVGYFDPLNNDELHEYFFFGQELFEHPSISISCGASLPNTVW